MGLLLFYLLLALSISFLCSVLEAVILSTPMTFVNLKVTEGGKSALLLKKLRQNLDRPLSAILSLNTIAHTVGAAGVGAQAAIVFGEAYLGITSAVLTLLILMLSEIIPKTIGSSYWRQLALISAHIIQAMIWICYPLVILSEQLTRLISSHNKEVTVSREEVSAMVNIGAEEGIFQDEETKAIQNVITLKTMRAREVMTPRIVVTTASEKMTCKEFFEQKNNFQHSRIPVYLDDFENIT
ncbi:MAG: CNNM domain-containing protein, partial [Bacteroidales bacterium]